MAFLTPLMTTVSPKAMTTDNISTSHRPRVPPLPINPAASRTSAGRNHRLLANCGNIRSQIGLLSFRLMKRKSDTSKDCNQDMRRSVATGPSRCQAETPGSSGTPKQPPKIEVKDQLQTGEEREE